MAPNGSLWVPPDSDAWADDYAKAPIELQGLFVHELTHVWQHRRGISLSLARHPFCSYRYALVPGRPLQRYGIEQQAEIVRHAFLIAAGAAVPGAAPAEAYRALLARAQEL